jgi:hypothetical protein
MPKIDEVVSYLRPGAEWVMHNDSLDELTFTDPTTKAITKTEFDKGAKDYEAQKAADALAKASAKEEILNRLGITAEEAILLLG